MARATTHGVTRNAAVLDDAAQAWGSEQGLLTAAAQGDARAVQVMFRTYVDRIHRQVARMLGPSDPDVEDVVQQTFLAALDGAARFDGRSTLSTWLFGIASRRALDAARARWRRRRWQRVATAVGVGTAPIEPERGAMASFDAARLLEQLAPEQRFVFLMHDVEGHTFAEISGLTGVGISTLHGRLSAARKRLERLTAKVRRGHDG